MIELVTPSKTILDSYVAALQRGWSAAPDREAPARELERLHANPDLFLARWDDREGKAAPITLPDGSVVARLPNYRRWIWDAEFAGVIDFRWQPGSSDLPQHKLGHIGYDVVPWKRKQGVATEALRLLLMEVRGLGLPFVELITDPDNMASQRVITANGGVFYESFIKPDRVGGGEGLRYRILLN